MSGRRGGRAVLVEDITSAEFARRAKKKPLVIVPFGSVEEHGSHLPLCTDSFQAEEIALRIAPMFDAMVCPAIRYGECRSTRNFPGTLSLSSDTVKGLARDVMAELWRNGIDKIMMISGHAGSSHMAAIREAALEVVEEHRQLKIMVLSDYDIAYELRGKEFPEDDGHGGLIETSRILGIRPKLVGESRPRGRERPPRFMILPDPERYFPTGIIGDS
ncbi:MAG TPA: creatininase family protein, partial [Thermoplasmata archaeon]|nr:creatininase family protein [Thermoplasmata archaeon]